MEHFNRFSEWGVMLSFDTFKLPEGWYKPQQDGDDVITSFHETDSDGGYFHQEETVIGSYDPETDILSVYPLERSKLK